MKIVFTYKFNFLIKEEIMTQRYAMAVRLKDEKENFTSKIMPSLA